MWAIAEALVDGLAGDAERIGDHLPGGAFFQRGGDRLFFQLIQAASHRDDRLERRERQLHVLGSVDLGAGKAIVGRHFHSLGNSTVVGNHKLPRVGILQV